MNSNTAITIASLCWVNSDDERWQAKLREAWQYLHDSKTAYLPSMRWFGIQAERLIKIGYIKLDKGKQHE